MVIHGTTRKKSANQTCSTTGKKREPRTCHPKPETLDFGVCSIVWSEYLCGPLSGEKKAAADVLVSWKEPFGVDDAPLAAHLFNRINRRRGTFVDS